MTLSYVNVTQLCTKLQNVSSDQEALTYISKQYFAVPTATIIIGMIIFMLIIAGVTIKRGWGKWSASVLIPLTIALILLFFTFYYSIIPLYFPSWNNLFGR